MAVVGAYGTPQLYFNLTAAATKDQLLSLINTISIPSGGIVIDPNLDK